MRFKYHTELEQIPDCPAAIYRERTAEAYRFVFRGDADASYQPPLAKNPRRALSWSDVKRCSGWALSFFVSVDSATRQFEALRKTNPNIHKTIGDSIALGTIKRADGVSCDPDDVGHFDLHEYENAALRHRFSVVVTLA